MATRRVDRDVARGRLAAERIRAAGGSALAGALAHIEATFSSAMHHSTLKDRVAQMIQDGAEHPHALRYRSLAERCRNADLDTAIILVERIRRAELEARARAMGRWGYCSRPRFAMLVLDELRVILRMLRRYAPADYPEVLASLFEEDRVESSRVSSYAAE